MTPIHIAAEFALLSIVQFLVYRKVDINTQVGGYPSGTPLHYSAHNGHLRVVEFLASHGANVNSKNDSIPIYCLIILLFIMLLRILTLLLSNF